MTLSTFKARVAGMLLRAAGAVAPIAPPASPPIILPGADDVPEEGAERERLYDRIAYTAIGCMGHVAAPEARAAAASVLRRTYPGIGPHVAAAHASAMAFNGQLQVLLKIETEAAAAVEAANAAAAAPVAA